MKDQNYRPHKQDHKPRNEGMGISYIRDWIYGGIDGVITTFAVVSGVVGANLAPFIIVVLGLANLVADGFSMAASNYLGTKSEEEEYQHYKHLEQEHMDKYPVGEREDIKALYRQKGFEEPVLEYIVQAIVADKALWLDTMLREQHGLPAHIRKPWKAALATFSAFILCGLVPLLPYFLSLPFTFYWSCGLTALTFIIIGSVKSNWSVHRWWYSGLTTLLVGGLAASLAFIVGYMFRA